MKENNQHKGHSIYIDERPKSSVDVSKFINCSCPRSMNKLRNCMFEGRDGNRVVVSAIKPIVARNELFINYNLNKIKESCNCLLYFIFSIY